MSITPTSRSGRFPTAAKLGVLAGALVVGSVAAGVMTCASAPEAETPDSPRKRSKNHTPPEPESCAVQLSASAPKVAALPLAEPPRSELSIGVSIPTKRITAEVNKNVPRALASAKRKPVGAAGEVTYNVTRGGLSYRLKNDRLLVTTPVSVAVKICKPLGPLCPTYGRCSPKLAATVSVPLTLGSDYKLAKSNASYSIAEGCTIAGTDQTPRIRKMADAQMVSIRRQLKRSIPEIKPLAEQFAALVTEPREVKGGGCLRIVPDLVAQAKPKLDKGVLSLRAVVGGAIQLTTEACSAPKPAVPELPKLSTLPANAAPSDKSVVAAALTIAWEQLGAELTESLGAASLEDGSEVVALRVQPGERDGKPLVLVGVTLKGRACGETWLSAEVAPNLVDAKLRLKNVKPLKGHAEVDGLASLLQAKATANLPPTLAAVAASLEEAMKLAPPKEVPVTVDVKLNPATATALPHRDGVMITVRREGTIHAKAQ